MTRSFLLKIIGLALIITLPAYPKAEEASEHKLQVENAYAFATGEMQKNGAAFMTFSNHSEEALAITKAQANVAEVIELHTHIMDGDKMKMRKVDSFEVPANESHTLKPMGDHIMLINLTQRLIEGESFPLTLYFSDHAPLTVNVDIVKPGQVPSHNGSNTNRTHEHHD